MGIMSWDLETLDLKPSAYIRCGKREPMREPETCVSTLPGRDVAHGYAFLVKLNLHDDVTAHRSGVRA